MTTYRILVTTVLVFVLPFDGAEAAERNGPRTWGGLWLGFGAGYSENSYRGGLI